MFFYKACYFLPHLIQLVAKERGKMRWPQGSIESLSLFIFSLRNDGNTLSKPPHQPASLHSHGNGRLRTNTLHAISFLHAKLLHHHFSFSVRGARDKRLTRLFKKTSEMSAGFSLVKFSKTAGLFFPAENKQRGENAFFFCGQLDVARPLRGRIRDP